MKKNNHPIHNSFTAILSSLLLLSAISCKKENAIVVNDDDTRMYKLPQGDQPYDKQILEFYSKYNSVILYNYRESDFIYQFTGPTELDLRAPAAGPNGIQETLDFFQEHWLSMYPEAFLKKNLPFKILLADSITKILEGLPSDTVQLPAIAGYRNVTFGLTGHLSGLSSDGIDSARGALHGAFWQQAFISNTIEMPPLFPNFPSYPRDITAMKNAGTFFYRNGMTGMMDAGDHIQMITAHSKTWLDANLYTPQNDPLGNYKKKYDILINYYQTKYNIDLQAIGNL